MKIVISPDSFQESLSAIAAACSKDISTRPGAGAAGGIGANVATTLKLGQNPYE